MTFIVKTLANAAALAVAVWLFNDITLDGKDTGTRALTLVLVALVFGLVTNLIASVLLYILLDRLFDKTSAARVRRGEARRIKARF